METSDTDISTIHYSEVTNDPINRSVKARAHQLLPQNRGKKLVFIAYLMIFRRLLEWWEPSVYFQTMEGVNQPF